MSRQVLTYPDLPDLALQYLPLSGGALTGNLGVGIARASWDASYRNIQIGLGGSVYAHTAYPQVGIGANMKFDTDGQVKYVANGQGCRLLLGQDATFYFDDVPNGTAGGVATVTQRMSLSAGGLDVNAGRINVGPRANLGNGTNGSILLRDDTSASRWVMGIPGSAGAKDWFLYDMAKGQRLSVSGANGSFSITPDANVCALQAAPAFGSQFWLANNLNTGSANLTLSAQGEVVIAGGAAGVGTSTRWCVFTPGGPQITIGPVSCYIGQGAANGNARISSAAANSRMEMYGTGLVPFTDGFMFLGETGYRWAQIYSSSGTISTCSAAVKEVIGPVNDTVALEQLMGLPAIYRFYYKHQKPVGGVLKEGEVPEMELVTDTSMEFIGPVAEEMPMDMKVGDVAVGNVNTEGHLMASLRGAVKEYRSRINELMLRIGALEGRMPA